MTDVTGFGLLGHALEVARGSQAMITINANELPFLSEVQTLAQQGFITGASGRNWKSYGDSIVLPEGTPAWQRDLLCDPQTSGGLLIACSSEQAGAILKTIIAEGYPDARIVGDVREVYLRSKSGSNLFHERQTQLRESL